MSSLGPPNTSHTRSANPLLPPGSPLPRAGGGGVRPIAPPQQAPAAVVNGTQQSNPSVAVQSNAVAGAGQGTSSSVTPAGAPPRPSSAVHPAPQTVPPASSPLPGQQRRQVPISLQAIIVIACALFAFVTSFVSFYVQYRFFLDEYKAQMRNRMNYFSEMYANQANVVANANATALAHTTNSAVFDYYEGTLSVAPHSSNTAAFSWYVVHAFALFSTGQVVTFVFSNDGTTFVVTAGSPVVSICEPDASNASSYHMTSWSIDATYKPSMQLPLPVTSCVDGRLGKDYVAIGASPSSFSQQPVVGSATPENGFAFLSAATDMSGSLLFVVSVQLASSALLEWTMQAVSNNEEMYFFDDNGKLLTMNIATTFTSSSSLSSVPSKYFQHVLGDLPSCFFQPSCVDLDRSVFDSDLSGFGWSTHELPFVTLSGRLWRILIIDTSHSALTGNDPIATGIGLIVGVTIASLIICFFIFRAWFAPLSELASHVRAAGQKDLVATSSNANSSTSTGTKFSIFSEIARAQEAFLSVQVSLQEIQSYIPQTLQSTVANAQKPAAAPSSSHPQRESTAGVTPGSVTDGATGDQVELLNVGVAGTSSHTSTAIIPETNAARGNDNANAVGEHSTREASRADTRSLTDSSLLRAEAERSRPNVGADQDTAGANSQTGDLMQCRMTTLHLRLHRFAKWDQIVHLMERAASIICSFDGVLDSVDYGSITATFNCHKEVSNHEQKAVKAAREILRVAHSDAFARVVEACPLTIGIDTDIAAALTVGFEDVKSRVVIGVGFELARKLASLAFDILGIEIAATATTVAAVGVDRPYVVVDFVEPKKEAIQVLAGAAGNPTTRKIVYEILPIGTSIPSDDTMKVYEGAFQDMRGRGDFDSAATKFNDLIHRPEVVNNNSVRHHCERLLSICQAMVASHSTASTSASPPSNESGFPESESLQTNELRNDRHSQLQAYVRCERCPWDCVPLEREVEEEPPAPPPPRSQRSGTSAQAGAAQPAASHPSYPSLGASAGNGGSSNLGAPDDPVLHHGSASGASVAADTSSNDN